MIKYRLSSARQFSLSMFFHFFGPREAATQEVCVDVVLSNLEVTLSETNSKRPCKIWDGCSKMIHFRLRWGPFFRDVLGF